VLRAHRHNRRREKEATYEAGAIVAFALFWTITAGAQGGGQATGAATGQSTSSDEAAIKQVADAYVKATLAGDAKAIAALYTEDAVEMPPNVPSVKGRAAIEQYYMKLFSGGTKVGQFALTHLLGGQLKTGNLWTGQNRQFRRGGRDQ
jgi:hypothetical protein